MEDNTKYIENYKSMLSNTSLIQNSNKPISIIIRNCEEKAFIDNLNF